MALKRVEKVLNDAVTRYPQLKGNYDDVHQAFELLKNSFRSGNKLLICGNGGSAADADHIVSELMKSFTLKRSLDQDVRKKLESISDIYGSHLANNLEPAIPAISLSAHVALNTAFSNDVDSELIYAQQVNGYGSVGDVLLCISTSGNSKNVIYAAVVAKSIGVKTIGLTGKLGGNLLKFCDSHIGVEGDNVAEIQELHLPVYHTLCKMLELEFFG